jgi:two-component sensor histidine kinase
MAMVHQMLYEAQDLSRISLDHYIRELAQLALASYPLTANRVVMRFELTPVQVFIDTAIPCGLILTELISNALKYAFPGERTGEIFLWLSRTAPDTIEFYVADNGVGVPEGFDFRNQPSLGLKLVITLVESQLGGAISFETGNGVTCRIHLTDTHYRARV